MKYEELYQLLGNLTEEQRQQTAIVTEEGASLEVRGLWIAEEDQINPTGESMEPKSAYKDDPDYIADEEPVVFPKGGILIMGTVAKIGTPVKAQ